MVLEFVCSTQRIIKHPSIIFLDAILITVLSVFLAKFIFPSDYISIGILAFITIGLMPIFAKLFSYNSYLYNYSEGFFQRHKTLMLQILYVSLGVFVAFTFVFFVVNQDTREELFATQFSEMEGIENTRNEIVGQVTGTKTKPENTFAYVFNLVFMNNLGVVLIAAILSFFYGAGAIYLIAFNASIIATVISNDILISMGGVAGFGSAIEGIGRALITIIGYIPHGLPEMLAYITISFAGAMLARDLMKGLFTTEFRGVIIKDLLLLTIASLFFLLIGALIEASYFL